MNDKEDALMLFIIMSFYGMVSVTIYSFEIMFTDINETTSGNWLLYSYSMILLLFASRKIYKLYHKYLHKYIKSSSDRIRKLWGMVNFKRTHNSDKKGIPF